MGLSKLILKGVVGYGVSKVVKDIIRNNAIVLTNADVVKIWIGGIVIGSMVTEAATKHVNARFDEMMVWFEKKEEEQTESS